MLRLHKCCCCIPLRYGAIIIGIIDMFPAIYGSYEAVYSLVKNDSEPIRYYVLAVIGALIYVIHTISCCLLIAAGLIDRAIICIPWLITIILRVLYDVIDAALDYPPETDTVVLVIVVVLVIILILVYVYFWLSIFSYFAEDVLEDDD